MEVSLQTVISILLPLTVAVVGVFAGTGYWTHRTKQAELTRKDSDEFKKVLLEQVDNLVKKVDELHRTREQLTHELYSLRGQLQNAQSEISSLHTVLKLRAMGLKPSTSGFTPLE